MDVFLTLILTLTLTRFFSICCILGSATAGRGTEVPAPQARTDFGPAPAGYVAGRGRGMGENRTDGRGPPGAPSGGGDNDHMDYSETNFDEFSGYSEALFGDTPYDEEDEEADRVYEAVDERMESRRIRKQEVSIVEINCQCYGE